METAMSHHDDLLALAGHAPDGWLAVARETLAERDYDGLSRLRSVLEPKLPQERLRHRFVPQLHGYDAADRAVVEAIRAQGGTHACWVTMRGGTDRVYLVQAAPRADLGAVTDAAQRALSEVEASPRVEVFADDAALPRYHQDALLAADLLWWRSAPPEVRVARTFDGSGRAGPWFVPQRELVVDPDEQLRLLEFLRGGELVLIARNRLPDVIAGKPDVVPGDLYSDGVWVWSAAMAYYLRRYQLALDQELVVHSIGKAPGARLTPLARHAVRTALSAMSPRPSLEGATT